MQVVLGLEAGQEEVTEEGCGQCHEKLMQSWCSLKVTLLLQQKEKKKKRIFPFPTSLHHYRHRLDKVLTERKLLGFSFLVSFLKCHSVYEEA